MKWGRIIRVLVVSVAAMAPWVFAEEGRIWQGEPAAKIGERWAFAYENDFLVPGTRDQDYTYGLSLSLAKNELVAAQSHSPLIMIDRLLGSKGKAYCGGIEFGLYGFTPEDIESDVLNIRDRPFASLVYISTSIEHHNAEQTEVRRSQITYGILGLGWVGQLQEATHALLDGDKPKGWDQQVAEGGEFTLRYNWSRQRLLNAGNSRTEWRLTQQVSLGYITETSLGVSFRSGQLNSVWHNFSPELASYAEASANTQRSREEWFFWGGAAVKARAYNAFLQGQFRHSAHTFDGGDLNHWIGEAWFGITRAWNNGIYASYGVRGHTSEVKSGVANRNVIWGGLLLGKRV